MLGACWTHAAVEEQLSAGCLLALSLRGFTAMNWLNPKPWLAQVYSNELAEPLTLACSGVQQGAGSP